MITLEDLIVNARIALRRGAIFDRAPPAVDLDDLRRHRRVEGLLLGLAVGDALGRPTEWRYDPERRHREFGTILDHVGSAHAPAGSVSDDTQLSFWTLERLLALGRFDFEDLASCFAARRQRIVGVGGNTSRALARHADRLASGRPAVHECAGDPQAEGRGNGALMRYPPLLLPHLRAPSPRLWEDVALAAFITHGSAAALSSAVAFTHLLWEVLRRPAGDVPAPEWWPDEYVRAAGGLEPWPLPPPAAGESVPAAFRGFSGTLCDFVDTRVRDAWRRRARVRDACSLDGFGSWADVTQTVPAVLLILMYHADSFESAVVAAVNDTKDNDTVASVVGAIVGALHGASCIRRRWIEGISSASLAVPPGREGGDREVIGRLAAEAAERFG